MSSAIAVLEANDQTRTWSTEHRKIDAFHARRVFNAPDVMNFSFSGRDAPSPKDAGCLGCTTEPPTETPRRAYGPSVGYGRWFHTHGACLIPLDHETEAHQPAACV